MKIVTLNIRHGGGTRIPALVNYLEAQKADVVVLTEFRMNGNAEPLRKSMAAIGFPHSEAAAIEKKQNSVCIFSRASFRPKKYPELGGLHQHRVLSAHYEKLAVFGVYFPQKQAKAAVFDFFIEQTRQPMEPHLIIGDFNTGLHLIDEAKSTFHCVDRFEKLETVGYVDCWRSRNPGKHEYSWHSTANTGFRIDHCFAGREVNDKICRIHYDSSTRTNSLTDHSALIVELDS